MKLLFGIAVAGLGLMLGACGSTSPTRQAATAPAPATGSAPAGGATQAGAVVSVSRNPAGGAILVDGSGRTLYLFERDHGTTSACTGSCAQTWPAFTAPGGPGAGSGVDGSKLRTASGQVPDQVAYNGHLLYYFSGDRAAGDTKGVGIAGWYPVSPGGDKVDQDGDHSTGY